MEPQHLLRRVRCPVFGIAGCVLALVFGLLVGCQAHSGRAPDQVFQGGSAGGRVLAMSPGSHLVAVGRTNGWINLWDAETGVKQGGWRVHGKSVTGLEFLDNERLISSGYDGQVVVWRPDGKRLRRWDAGAPITALASASGQGPVLTGHADGMVKRWRLDGSQIDQRSGHNGAVRALAVASYGDTFASSGHDGQVMLWTSDAVPMPLPPPGTDARTLVFTPDATALLGAGWFNVYRWNVASRSLETLPTEHQGIINDLNYLPDGRLASISRQTDSSVLIIDPQSGSTLERFQGHQLCGSAVAPSADGLYLSSTSDDATVRVWRLDGPAPEL
jgi:WD40 repeat protein